MKLSLRKSTIAVGKVLLAIVRTLFAVIAGTVLIAYCTRHVTGTMDPSWWGLLISSAVACLYWSERFHPSPKWRRLVSDLQIESRCGSPPRVRRLPDGSLVQEYSDGTSITWKDGKIVEFYAKPPHDPA